MKKTVFALAFVVLAGIGITLHATNRKLSKSLEGIDWENATDIPIHQ